MKKKLFIIGFIVVLMFGAVGCGGGDSSSGDAGGTDVSDKSEIPYFTDGVLETETCKFEIKEAKVFDPNPDWGETKPYIVIVYDYTNKSDENVMPTIDWASCFDVDQESSATTLESSLAIVPDEYTDMVNMTIAEVKPDKTVTCAAHYDLEDKESPVTLIGSDGMFGKELGTYTINLK